MYKGKFDAESRGQNDPGAVLEQILADREKAAAARAARKNAAAARPAAGQGVSLDKPAAPAARPAAPAARPAAPAAKPAAPAVRPAAPAAKPAAPAVRPAAPAAKPAAPAARPAAPAARPAAPAVKPAAPAARPAAPAARPAAPARPVPPAARPAAPAAKPAAAKKRSSGAGGLVFYSIYFAMILVFCVGIFLTLNWLNGWLKAYEAAQPDIKCQEVFDQLFTNPDWHLLYQASGAEGTEFEGEDQYVEHMRDKVGSQPLNYVETSAGLSGNKKFNVRLGTEKIASFTLEGQQDRITDIPDWKLGKVELVMERKQSLTIRILEGHQVYVNGVPLDDSYTIQRASSKADEFLPVGTPTVTTCIQQISGLMAVPSLVVYNETGTATMSVVYNPDTGMYEEQTDAIAITDEERTAVFGALESMAGFMINAAGSRAGVAKYFDGTSQAYKDIMAMNSELWMNKDRGHTFVSEEISSYTKYSDNMFYVRASLVMQATLNDGSVKDFDVAKSMFFTKKDGKWVCYNLMNNDVSDPVGEVRITFVDAAGSTISSDFYATDAEKVQCPVINVPSGKVFSGWCSVETDDAGKVSWNVVFSPDSTGLVYNSGRTLTPMTLYPLFENM